MAFSDWLNRVFGKGSWIDNQLTNLDQNLLGGLVGRTKERIGDVGDSLVNSLTGAGLSGADREAQVHQDMREDTQYQRTVADMRAAGLNPMMLAGGASVNHAGSAVAGNAGSMSLGDLINAGLADKQAKLLDAQIKNIDKDTESKEAGIKKTLAEVLHINADTQRIADTRRVLQEQAEKLRLDNYVSDILKGVRVEQERLNIVLTDEQIKSVQTATSKAAEEIRLIAEQIESEDAKQALMSSQSALLGLNIKDKTLYLTYADALYKAESEEARSNADDAALRFAYDKALLTDDYANAIIDKAKSEGALNKNFAWREELVRDLVENKKRPAKYKDQLSNSQWSDLREGLLDPVFFNATATGYSRESNRGSITNR